MKSDIRAETGPHADKQHYCCKKDECPEVHRQPSHSSLFPKVRKKKTTATDIGGGNERGQKVAHEIDAQLSSIHVNQTREE